MRVLVTGGAGFIGSHLVDALVRDGHEVRVLDNLSNGKRENLNPKADFLVGDVRRAEDLAEAIEDCEVVFHLAALGSVPRSVANPVDSHDVNATGTLLLLEAARRAGVRRVVYSGSSSAYGDAPEASKHEGLPVSPLSPYAASKLCGEHYCRVYGHIHGLGVVILRYFNVFGPRQRPDSEYAAVIPKFIQAMMDRRPLTINGDGMQARDFTYVSNVVEANLRAMSGPHGVSTVNIACAHPVSLLQLVNELESLFGRQAALEFLPPRTGDILNSKADINRAELLLGWRPSVSFREGLAQTVYSLHGPNVYRANRTENIV